MPAATSSKDLEPGTLRLEEFLPYRLSRLSNTISAGISATYTHRHRLSVTEWRVLAIIGRFPGMSAREATIKGALDKVAVSRAVNRLVDQGLVIRTTAVDDRRRSVLKLSPQGLNVYHEITPAAMDYEQLLLAALDAAERRSLNKVLDKLWRRAQQLEESWSAPV